MAVAVVHAGLACCAVESTAVDLVAQGQALAELDPGDLAHVLVVAGTVTRALADAVTRAYEALPEPRIVVAFGSCAISGGPYWDSYAVCAGAEELVPVQIRVPGCPPTPLDLARALHQAVGLARA